jgi:hypothetical protein
MWNVLSDEDSKTNRDTWQNILPIRPWLVAIPHIISLSARLKNHYNVRQRHDRHVKCGSEARGARHRDFLRDLNVASSFPIAFSTKRWVALGH